VHPAFFIYSIHIYFLEILPLIDIVVLNISQFVPFSYVICYKLLVIRITVNY
jgi:hypothetical protein